VIETYAHERRERTVVMIARLWRIAALRSH
jgi:hypothetical protein